MRRRIPRPPGQFEREERGRRIAGLAFGALFLAAVLSASIGAFGAVIGVVVWSPLPAGFFAWWLLRGGTENRYWLRWILMRGDEGRHVAFDSVALRFDVLEGRILVQAAGVFHALEAESGEAACRRLAIRYGKDGFFRRDRGAWWFDEKSLLHWLETRADRHEPLAVRFRSWLDREVLPGLRRQARSDG